MRLAHQPCPSVKDWSCAMTQAADHITHAAQNGASSYVFLSASIFTRLRTHGPNLSVKPTRSGLRPPRAAYLIR